MGRRGAKCVEVGRGGGGGGGKGVWHTHGVSDIRAKDHVGLAW